MMDIAYELIPYSLKEMTCGKSRSILNNPQCYAYVLLIYDGLCLWEEDGTTPVLHIKWAKHFINSISKFDDSVRTRLIILEPKVRYFVPSYLNYNYLVTTELHLKKKMYFIFN